MAHPSIKNAALDICQYWQAWLEREVDLKQYLLLRFFRFSNRFFQKHALPPPPKKKKKKGKKNM